MTKVILVYPFFQPSKDNSIFRFPPLGLGYIASALTKYGAKVKLVDCTFMTRKEAMTKIRRSNPEIIGFYSMFSMKKTTLQMARELKSSCSFLIVGGPLPTLDPSDYLEVFDIAIIGEGEKTIIDLVEALDHKQPIKNVRGIAYKEAGAVKFTAPQPFIEDLDTIEFPSREFFDNQAYKEYYLSRFGYTTSPLISSRGCPFSCNFCSRPVFGNSFRTRSPENIVDEVEEIEKIGYDRVWFADDCFTLNRDHLVNVCDLLVRRNIGVGWECLSRVDTMDKTVAESMKDAGCERVFFGIESGNNEILRKMNKKITTSQARKAVKIVKDAGIDVGAFFIIGYPGETDDTILDTVNFASKLPLDYLSFTLPYPIPGTNLHERVKDNGQKIVDDWEEPKNWSLIRHKLLYGSGFSEGKLKIAIGKAQLQFYARRHLAKKFYQNVGEPLERLGDRAFKMLR